MVEGTNFSLAVLRHETISFSFPLSPNLRLESYVKCLEFMGVEFLVLFHLFVFLSSTFFLFPLHGPWTSFEITGDAPVWTQGSHWYVPLCLG